MGLQQCLYSKKEKYRLFKSALFFYCCLTKKFPLFLYACVQKIMHPDGITTVPCDLGGQAYISSVIL